MSAQPRFAPRRFAAPFAPSMRRLLSSLCLALVACGGGGSQTTTTQPGDNGTLVDETAFSMAAGAALPSAEDRSVTTDQSVSLTSGTLRYQTETGHLVARDPVSQTAQASVFYVAYTRKDVEPTRRPLIFFYNGGPGSASLWLHLGSYGPKRLQIGFPSTDVPQPFVLMDNQETLLADADLVFIDAVGTGYSQAIAPLTNASFWGVDADARLFRDFVLRFIELKQRKTSPLVVFGESYGGLRSPLLAAELLQAGAPLQGVVLQSAILNYNSNCDVVAQRISCSSYFPSYAASAAWFKRASPTPSDIPSHAAQAIAFASAQFEPAVQLYLRSGTPLGAPLLQQLADYTGLATTLWSQQPLLPPDTVRSQLVPGQLLGRYDARVAAPLGSALANSGDPSSAAIDGPFSQAISAYLTQTLKYRARSAYQTSNDAAIRQWDWRHDGHELPDAIPDLALALALKPDLQLLVVGGYNDLATPFWLTEQDLARISPVPPGLQLTRRLGGHMTYLDDQVRPQLKADLSAFLSRLPRP